MSNKLAIELGSGQANWLILIFFMVKADIYGENPIHREIPLFSLGFSFMVGR